MGQGGLYITATADASSFLASVPPPNLSVSPSTVLSELHTGHFLHDNVTFPSTSHGIKGRSEQCYSA